MDKLDKTARSQKTPVGNKKGTSTRQALRLGLGATIGFVMATILLGIAIGNHMSTNWEDRGEVAKFIATHCTKNFDVASGQELLRETAPIEVRLRVRERDYVYRTDKKRIIPESVPYADLVALPKAPTQSKNIQTPLLAFGTLATSAAQLFGPKVGVSLNLLGKNKFVVAAAAVVVVVVVGAGVYWGFRMGYKPDPDFSTKAFEEKLNDTMLWDGIATQYRNDELRRFRPEAAPSATP